jgi:iron complex outermembrane recepter protein
MPRRSSGVLPGPGSPRTAARRAWWRIRSPVLSGAGACGAFLFLEDGLPTRPAGFCNVNQLFELNLEQARPSRWCAVPGAPCTDPTRCTGRSTCSCPRPATGSRPRLLLTPARPTTCAGASAGRWDGARGLRLTGQVRAATADGGTTASYGPGQAERGLAGARRRTPSAKRASPPRPCARTRPATSRARGVPGRAPAPEQPEPGGLPRRRQPARLPRVATRRRRNGGFELRPYLRASTMRFLQHFLPGPAARGERPGKRWGCSSHEVGGGWRNVALRRSTWRWPRASWSSSRRARPTGRAAPRGRHPARPVSITTTKCARTRVAPWAHWERPLAER